MSRSVLVTLGCCLLAVILAVIDQANDTTLWTAMFATAVLVVSTALVAFATFRTLGQSDDEEDDEGPG